MTVDLNAGIMPFVRTKNITKVNESEYVVRTLEIMTSQKLGSAFVVDGEEKLVGVITDGDIRRRLLSDQRPAGALMIEDTASFMTRHFKSMDAESSLNDALANFIKDKVWDIPIIDSKGMLLGVLHLQDVLPLLVDN